MPLELRDLQAAFAAHVAGTDRVNLVDAIVGDTIPAAARLGVYRHHVCESLSAALAATFPTVQAVVGDAFFGRLARDFISRCLPSQPVLTEYGNDLADFIAGYAPASGLPYLADVARLDWALNCSFHAPSGPYLGVAELSTIETERLPSLSVTLAAGTSLVSSPYPLGAIWKACQADGDTGSVNLNSGGAHLLVLRRPDDAAFISLNSGEAAFVAALIEGQTLETAAGAAFGVDAAFALSSSFARLLGLQAFAAVQ